MEINREEFETCPETSGEICLDLVSSWRFNFLRRKWVQISGIGLLILFVNVLQSGQDRLSDRFVLMTEEFDQFRRIIFVSPLHQEICTTYLPIVVADSLNGEFTITLSSLDTSLFVGKRLYKLMGNFPIRLAVLFPDSQTILLDGKTVPFEKIVSYYVIDGEKFIFDIYKKLPFESYFKEKTITASTLFSSKRLEKNSGKNISAILDEQPTIKAVRSQLNTGKNLLVRSIIFSSSFVFFGLVVYFVLGLKKNSFTGENLKSLGSRYNKTFGGASKKRSKPPSKSDNDKILSIKQIMDTHSLSYDEASIYLNMTKRKETVEE